MSDDDRMTFNVKGLEKLLTALKARPPVARVGILGANATKKHTEEGGSESDLTNATIGAFHEFGTTKLPQRSFLRWPLALHLDKKMQSSGALKEDTMKEVIATGSVLPWLKKIAILAEAIVLEAFDTGGNGQWKPSIMGPKKVKQTLVETQQLRDSITSEAKEQ